jgi:hypothetical protein
MASVLGSPLCLASPDVDEDGAPGDMDIAPFCSTDAGPKSPNLSPPPPSIDENDEDDP